MVSFPSVTTWLPAAGLGAAEPVVAGVEDQVPVRVARLPEVDDQVGFGLWTRE
jgi:hypothetical protein